MALAAQLETSIRLFTAAAHVEVRENGRRGIPFTSLSWEVRGASDKPLLHLWSESYNITRRVLAITDHSDQRLALAVERFGRRKPEQLEFLRVEFRRSPRELSREEFCARLTRILAEQFPDETVESFSVSSDLEHSLSGNYARGILRRGSLSWAVLAAPDGASRDSIENSLTFALLWLDRTRQSSRNVNVAGLRLIVPKGAAALAAHRSQALRPQLSIELYERDPLNETLRKLEPKSAGNLKTWLVPHRETQALLDRAGPALAPVLALSPQNLTLHPSVPAREVCLRFRGLAIAKWDDDRVFFGTTESREELTRSSQARLERLLKSLELHRQPLTSDTRHSLYRAQPERWLESIIRQDVTLIDAALDSRFVYEQVFAQTGGQHGILDLLAVTRTGRLAILELKAGEHLHLPLQAADYWLRIRRHLDQGDFARLGYFTGIQLQSAPPIAYLVAPALRFHPSTDALLRYLTPEIEVVRVGLAETWRRGISVILRQ